MYEMDSGLEAGDMAPDFSLGDSLGDTVRLSGYRGKANVLVAFYRGESDPYSMRWLSELSGDYLQIRGLDTEVLAISGDDERTALDTGGRYGLPFRLLCDPGCRVAREYGVFDSFTNTPACAAFVLDRAGKVRYRYVSGAPPDLPPNTEIIRQLRDMA
jgi:peroxiredoxin Q/BCP